MSLLAAGCIRPTWPSGSGTVGVLHPGLVAIGNLHLQQLSLSCTVEVLGVCVFSLVQTIRTLGAKVSQVRG